MKLTQKELTILKGKELFILTEFIRVCSILNCKYWVTGGTLLGAVRHNGFIPWDDDIDVNMPFDDFKKLKDNWTSVSSPAFLFQNKETDQQYLFPWAKIRLVNSLFLEKTSEKLPINHGIFIDIFPLFSYSDEPREQKRFSRDYRILMNRVNSVFSVEDKNELANLFCLVFSGFKSPADASTCLWRKMQIENEKNQSSKTYGSMSFTMQFVPKSFFDKLVPHKFETMMVNIPNQFDPFLRFIYGDYTKLPPLAERYPHHELSAFNPDGI